MVAKTVSNAKNESSECLSANVSINRLNVLVPFFISLAIALIISDSSLDAFKDMLTAISKSSAISP